MFLVAERTDIETVAMTLYGEARGEHLLDRLGVGAVIRERVLRPGWWGKDWQSVCLAPHQFSCWGQYDEAHKRNYDAMVNAYLNDPDTYYPMLLLAEYIIRQMTDRDVRALFEWVDHPDDHPTHYFSKPLTEPPKAWGDDIEEVKPRFPSAFRWFVVRQGRPKRRG